MSEAKVKVVVKERFKHGFDTFEVGDVRSVNAEDAADFHKAGWVSIEGKQDNDLDLTPKELAVRNSKHVSKATSPV